jgi:hypothetical protein
MLAKTLATEIEAVRASYHFYGCRESNVLAQEIDRIRQAITEYLLPVQPRSAAAGFDLGGRQTRLPCHCHAPRKVPIHNSQHSPSSLQFGGAAVSAGVSRALELITLGPPSSRFPDPGTNIQSG